MMMTPTAMPAFAPVESRSALGPFCSLVFVSSPGVDPDVAEFLLPDEPCEAVWRELVSPGVERLVDDVAPVPVALVDERLPEVGGEDVGLGVVLEQDAVM
jgi:hypothetical protein